MLKRKKQITAFIFTLLALSFLVSTPTSAVTMPSIEITKAQGTVVDATGKPVKFAKVYGNCNGEDSKTLGNSKGQFTLQFVSKGACNEGDTVVVTAEGEDGNTYHGSGIVVMKKDGKIVDINFAQLRFTIFNVPEYNLTTSVLAILVSVGAYFLFARKLHFAKVY